MRQVAALVLLAACGGEAHPELHFDLLVSERGVYVTAHEAARPDATSPVPFAHAGECDETSDGWSCDGPCPGEWLGELRLERGGEVLAEGRYDAPWGSGVSLDDGSIGGATLVIEDLDGAEVAVELPTTAVPTAVIDGVEAIPAGVSREDIAITWHTLDAETAVIEVSGGYGGPRCHVEATEDTTTLEFYAGTVIGEAYVTAYAAPVLAETAFGDAEIWVGDTAVFDFR